MNNEVTLEELNKPTDTELASLRCAGWMVDVTLSWQDNMGMGLASGTLSAKRVSEWMEELRTLLSEADPEDEHMIRVRLDEGF